LVKDQAYLVPKRSVFNKVVADSTFELDVAAFLDSCPDILSFVKNSQSTQFRMEYRNADGSIANYYPDFLVKRTGTEIWVIETKGREDLDDPPKWERLQQWCADATAHDGRRSFKPLFVRQENYEKYQPKDFSALVASAQWCICMAQKTEKSRQFRPVVSVGPKACHATQARIHDATIMKEPGIERPL
jgi:type III restriction enzyme